MTPLEAWQEYTADLPSPQSYIDFGFIVLITSALQRRVWYYGEGEGSEDGRLFPNLYVVEVGKPALGKGLIITRVASLLKHHKDARRGKVMTALGPEEAELIPVGADCATFEQILVELTNSKSAPIITVNDAGKKVPYSHCSLAFVLEELSSLFRAHHNEVVKLLLRTYDCNDYNYKTKHGQPDLIRRCCMNFFAGAQMDFLQEAHDLKIFGQGFSSRTIWLFETARRFNRFHQHGEAPKKAAAREVLVDHVKKLTALYGQLSYNQEVYDFLEQWYTTVCCPAEALAGPRMQGYYGRKKVHVLKVAAAIHFSRSYDYEITLTDIKEAIAMLDAIEPKMAAGLNIVGRNKLTPFARDIFEMIESTGKTGAHVATIYSAFLADLEMAEIDKLLNELTIIEKITQVNTDKGIIYVAAT